MVYLPFSCCVYQLCYHRNQRASTLGVDLVLPPVELLQLAQAGLMLSLRYVPP